MACIRKRRGRYVVDYYDSAGVRRTPSFDTRAAAEDRLGEVLSEGRQKSEPSVPPNITVADYAHHWLETLGATDLKPRTLESYANTLRLHILPAIGTLRVRNLRKARVKALLVEKAGTRAGAGEAPLARNTLRIIHAVLRAMLYAAIDDEIITTNPAARLGKRLRLITPKQVRQGAVEQKALTEAQLARFLETVWKKARRLYPVFLTMARTGIRIGEALALQWPDLDLRARSLAIRRTLADDGTRVDTPKSGTGRSVDVSLQLAETLRRLQVVRKTEALRKGWREVPLWIFTTPRGTRLDPHNVRRAFARVLEVAKLPLHFTPHSLRHTYASLLISSGKSPAYVQRQLGHASITLTVDTYGQWLPMGNHGAVDALDDPTWRGRTPRIDAARLVATGGSNDDSSTEPSPQVPDSEDGPPEDRTPNPLIKSQSRPRLMPSRVSASHSRNG